MICFKAYGTVDELLLLLLLLFFFLFFFLATTVGGGYINGTAESIATMGLVWTLAPFGIFVGLILGTSRTLFLRAKLFPLSSFLKEKPGFPSFSFVRRTGVRPTNEEATVRYDVRRLPVAPRCNSETAIQQLRGGSVVFGGDGRRRPVVGVDTGRFRYLLSKSSHMHFAF